MEATFQRIPEHLKNPVRPMESTAALWHLFWELNTERQYFSTGLSQRIPVSKIRAEIKNFGYADYEAEILKDVIMKMDHDYVKYDEARILASRERSRKPEA